MDSRAPLARPTRNDRRSILHAIPDLASLVRDDACQSSQCMLAHDAREACDQRLLRNLELRLDAVTLQRMDIEIGAALLGEDGDGGGAAELGERAVDLVAREKARQVGSEQAAVHAPRDDRRAGAEQEVQESGAFAAAVALGGIEAEVEALRIFRLGGRAADHRMLAQERIHLAGHVGGEARDAPVLHLDPFGMRAGGADQPVLDAGAENQRLLAAHHVGGARARARRTGRE